MKKIIPVLGAMLLVMVLAAGCNRTAAAKNAAPVTLRFAYWGGDNRHRITGEAVSLFEQTHPGIKINMEISGGSGDHFVKIDTQIAGGSGPDIIQMGGNIADYAVLKPVLLPLNKYSGGLLNTRVIDPSVLADGQGSWNGELYGVCLGTNMLVLAYNKSLLERYAAPLPGKIMSWDEFRSWGRAAAAKLPAGIFPVTDNSTDQTNYLKFYMAQLGTPLWDGSTTHATLESIRRWIDLWEDLRAEKIIPDPETTASYQESGTDTSSLVAGKTAMALLWSNTFGSYQQAMDDELDLVQLPDLQSGAIWVQPSQYLTVWKDSPHADEAVTFIDFFVNNPEAAKILGNDRGFTSSSAAREAVQSVATATDLKVYEYYAAAAPFASPWKGTFPNDQEFISTHKLILQRVAFGQISRQQGAQQVYDMIRRLLVK